MDGKIIPEYEFILSIYFEPEFNLSETKIINTEPDHDIFISGTISNQITVCFF